MTIGERIADIRKTSHLSQEAFGDSLGVTRQAISKWESDGSIPDVDKLILISKTYSVSVGWILGIEDKTELEEFSDKQLELVKEIVRQCSKEFEQNTSAPTISETPKRKKHKLLIALIIIAAVIFAVWCGNMSDRLLSLENSQGYLRSQISNVESTVSSQTSILTRQIEEILNAQNSVLADFGYEITGYDYAADTVDIEIYMIPKTYTDGMSVVFAAVSDDISFTADGIEGANHRFEGTVTCKMSDCINLTVAITKDGIVETQLIDVVDHIRSETLPTIYFASSSSIWGSIDSLPDAGQYEDIYIAEDTYSTASQNGIVLTGVKVYLIFNEEIINSFECTKTDTDSYHEDWYTSYVFNYKLSEGDTFQYAAVATDNYDRQHLIYDSRYIVKNGFIDYDVSYKFDDTDNDIYGLLELE